MKPFRTDTELKEHEHGRSSAFAEVVRYVEKMMDEVRTVALPLIRSRRDAKDVEAALRLLADVRDFARNRIAT